MFSNELLSHLKGEKFSNRLRVDVKELLKSKNKNRINTIKDWVAGQRVLHVGCCDHIPLIQEKIDRGIWMHKEICDVASYTHGIDIDKSAIDFVHNLGFTNISYFNILEDDLNIIPDIENKFDVMILGEILEHVNDPVLFLKQIHEKFNNKVDHLIITVPNAFSHSAIKESSKNVEVINSDHRFWFTPFTLMKIAILAGYTLVELEMTHDQSRSIGYRAKLKILPYIKRRRLLSQLKNVELRRESIVLKIKF